MSLMFVVVVSIGAMALIGFAIAGQRHQRRAGAAPAGSAGDGHVPFVATDGGGDCGSDGGGCGGDGGGGGD